MQNQLCVPVDTLNMLNIYTQAIWFWISTDLNNKAEKTGQVVKYVIYVYYCLSYCECNTIMTDLINLIKNFYSTALGFDNSIWLDPL